MFADFLGYGGCVFANRLRYGSFGGSVLYPSLNDFSLFQGQMGVVISFHNLSLLRHLHSGGVTLIMIYGFFSCKFYLDSPAQVTSTRTRPLWNLLFQFTRFFAAPKGIIQTCMATSFVV